MVFTFTSSCGQTQNNSTEKEAEKMLQEFYTSYFTVFATEPPGTSSQKKLEMLQKQYCTEAFYRKIPDIIEQTESDPFLKAQDSDINWLQTLTVIKDEQIKNEYIVSYSYDRLVDVNPDKTVKETVTIHVTVVKEGESYKIDSVK